jgi:hypothetical protein
MKHLDDVDSLGYRYYFQFTLTPYGNDIEPDIKKDAVSAAFIELSERIGRERVIWRYDPVLVNEKYSPGFHADHFGAMAEKLHPYTKKCVISFVDAYGFLADSFREHAVSTPSPGQIEDIATQISGIAHSLPGGLEVASCCEKADLAEYGIGRSKCIDDELIARISGRPGKYKKDPSQRRGCGCTESRDIGTYNTCLHGCVYCYARRGRMTARRYGRDSPLLCDTVDPVNDRIKTIDLRGGGAASELQF